MITFVVDVPVPSMGATVSEVLIVSLKTEVGQRVKKGQKIAELESDKSLFDYEAPADGLVVSLPIKPGEALKPGAIFVTLETSDESLRHLESKIVLASDSVPLPAVASSVESSWTPKARKLAKEACVNPAEMVGLRATGPGGRVSGDDVSRWLASRKS